MSAVQSNAPSAPNPLDLITCHYKEGYKTSEFYAALAAGIAQAVIVAFDPSKPLAKQLTNLTWIAIAYVLSRSGLKIARATSSAKVVAADVTARAVSANASDGGGWTDAAGNGGSYAAPDAIDRAVGEWITQLRNLVDLRDRGELSPEEFARAREQLQA